MLHNLTYQVYASSCGDIRKPNQATMLLLQEEDQTTEILVH